MRSKKRHSGKTLLLLIGIRRAHLIYKGAVAFLLNEEFVPQPDDGDAEIDRLKSMLQKGRPAERHEALARLVAVRAESALTQCLRARDVTTVQLATAGLWECWLNEKGPAARRQIEQGIDRMDAGDFKAAEQIFLSLIKTYPDWAEAINKQATLLYLRGCPGDSLDLCELVVELKPNHFGAWNGMALCAVQLEKWEVAARAAKEALRLQPGAGANQDILELAKTRLKEEG
jgi:tetratricopeptide (TPR) repeat protein